MIPWELARHLSPRTRMLLEARLMCALTTPGLVLLATMMAVDLVEAPPRVSRDLLKFCQSFRVMRVDFDGTKGGD